MKLLVINTVGVEKDGITSWIIQMFNTMDKSSIDVIDTIAFEGADQAIVHKLEAAGVRTHTLPSRKKRPLAYARALRNLVKENAYDLVHVNGSSGTTAIELICCVASGVKGRIVHSHNTSSMFTTYDKLLRPAMSAICTDRFACGEAAGKWLFGNKQFTIIPNGRDFAEYSFDPDTRIQVRHRLGLSSRHIAIGHVGYFNEQKNHRFLIDAFAMALEQNQNLRLFLLGDGTLRRDIEAQVNSLGLAQSVLFLGHTPRVSDYLSALDLAVLPSLYEGFPNVAIEWQISGLPSLISDSVSDECAVTDLIRFIPAANTTAWAHEIASTVPVDRMSTSSAARRLLREAGYEIAVGAAKLQASYTEIARREGISLESILQGRELNDEVTKDLH